MMRRSSTLKPFHVSRFTFSRISLVCFAIFAIALLSVANAEEWATYRYDNARSGVTTEKLATSLSLYWTFKPAHAPKPAWMKPAEELQRMHFDSAYHVTVANGMVYFGSSVDNKTYAVDAGTGEVRWTFFTEGPVRFAPAIWKGRVYVGSDDGYVYCLEAEDGKLVWKYRAGPTDEKVIGNGRMISLWPVRTSVLVDDDVVYFGAGVFPYEGLYICALKADDGTVIWKNDTIGDHAHELNYGGISPQSYLVASENVLYVPSGRAMPAAFDRESGEFLYYCSPGGKVGGTWALMAEGELIAGVDLSGIPAKVAYDEKTGKRKRDVYAWFPGIDLVVTSDVSYALTEDGVHAIARAAYPHISAKLSRLRADQEKLTAMLSDLEDKLAEVDEKMREEVNKQIDETTQRIDELVEEEGESLKAAACKWQYMGKNLCSLILAGDVVFAGGEGMVVAVDAQTGKELWDSPLEGKAYGLAASNGHLFVSTDKGNIYCFGMEEVSRPKEIKPRDPRVRGDYSPYPEDKLTSVYESATESILQETGIKKGYCLVLDAGTGRLAFELARRTELEIVGIEDDPKKVEKAKKNLDAAGLYGSRVVVEQWDLSSLPDYFANLIVSDRMIASVGAMPASPLHAPIEEISRVLRPYGGVAYIPDTGYSILDTGYEHRASSIKDLLLLTRGELEGAGSWTQLYGNPQNTACSDDQLVKAPLGLLWFGEPGPEKMVERHARAESPVAIDGRLFVQGGEVIMAYDAYNGTLLWEREIPGAVRVRVDVDGGNLALTEEGLYVAVFDKCYRLDPATGETVRTYEMPASSDGSPRRWGYISCVGKTLFGSTATPLRSEYAAIWKSLVRGEGTWESVIEVPRGYRAYVQRYMARYSVPDEKTYAAFQRGGALWRFMANAPAWGSQRSPKGALTERMMTGDSIFAMDTETGKPLWIYCGDKIANIAVTIGDGTIFFAEASVTEEQKASALEEKQELVKRGIYEEGDEASLGPEDADVRLIVALDIATGKKLWERPLDLTGCGGDKVGAAYHDGLLLFFGCFSNHDGGLFRDGSLTWRRITTLKGKTGDVVWSRPLNYLRRPLIVGDTIIIEPRACDVHTGEIKMRSHPITGQQVPWEFLRPGHSCSITSASPNAIFYRSYCHAVYDLVEDRGLTLLGAIRPGCWLSLIAANGLFTSPEASSGCTCSFPLRSTFVMTHRNPKRQRDWTVFITHGSMTPARHFAINFGAPGDMKDDEGTLWFGYPRPRTGYGVKFDLNEETIQGMGYFCQDFKGVSVEGSDRAWLFTSGYLGLLKCEVPLINDIWGEEPSAYTVRLGFMAPSGDQKGERVFDAKLQGDVVLKDFDILEAAGAPDKAVIKELQGVKVEDNLAVELVPKTPNPMITQAPMINFIEVIREDASVVKGFIPSRSIEMSDAGAKLEAAKVELNRKNYDKALEMYHTVLDAAPSAELKLQALEGMAVIGSPKSLGRAERYCRDVSPILWDYKEPEPELRDGAIEVYAAVATKMAETDKQKAIKMLKHALTITSGLSGIRQQVVTDLENLGVEIGADAAKAGFITHWHLIGPFPRPSGADWKESLDEVCVDEPNVNLSRPYQVGDKVLKWVRYVSGQGMIDLEKLFEPNTNVSVYAYTEVLLPEERELFLKIGSDDSFKCWFNGEVAGRHESDRDWEADQDTLKVKGKKGANTVLLKITQGGDEWAFSAKLTDVNDNPIPEVRPHAHAGVSQSTNR
jgi:outer membrane protein assembly factor BamB